MRRNWRIYVLLPLSLVAVTIICLSLKLTTARAQSATGPVLKAAVPLRPLAALSTVPVPSVPELSIYVRNNAAAIAMGKALFWDMQAGSDGVQACATCHFNAGADSRPTNQISPGIKAGDSNFQVGNIAGPNGYYPNYKLNPGTAGAGFGGYHDGDFPFHKQGNVDTRNNPTTDVNDVVSSQGVFSSNFDNIVVGSGVDKVTMTSDAVFSFPDPKDPTKRINTRKVEPRNTPTVVNAAYNFRNFWDGRAMNVCNGANPFGDRDTTSHFYSTTGVNAVPKQVLVRLSNSALCSQSLGPPLSSFEMGSNGRNFKALGKKLLSLNPLQNFGKTTPLGKQAVDPLDSVLGIYRRIPLHGDPVFRKGGLKDGYDDMIQAAFRPAYWQSNIHICVAADGSESMIIPAKHQVCPANTEDYSQMAYNFSLFWGIAIQLYEDTLLANQTPLDQYLAQQSTYTLQGDSMTNSFTVPLAPNVTPYSVSVVQLNPLLDASDQEVFAFDDGNSNVIGVGVTQAKVDYVGGTLSIFFDSPPQTAFPIKISYSVGTTPLTQAQLHGLQLFQTKARCIACHGGPELTNASVGNVTAAPLERMVMGDFNVRVYDDGWYNIGVRPGTDDIGLADVDGITGSGKPLATAEFLRQQVCADPTVSIMIPGRVNEGITAAPLSCSDQTANKGNVKVPGLRNVALTAPYFHNGGTLTLEQVVEFYNRGGDFVDSLDQQPLIDPNITPLFLTAQEKTDLVDFLRQGLTDLRTVNQQAPFDHPELFVPNGHPVDAGGYPMNDPNHLGQAQDLAYPLKQVPANGKRGAAPQKTFLQELLTP